MIKQNLKKIKYKGYLNRHKEAGLVRDLGISYPVTAIKKRRDLVVKIGDMNKLLSQKDYRVKNTVIDVVWRRVEKGSPTYVFEIQVGGDIYHALS